MATKTSRRKYQLTWDDSRRRWKKVYKGKQYVFPARDDETKATSYRRCWQLWLDKKVELDSKLDDSKPHVEDYRQAIDIRTRLCDYIISEGLSDDEASLRYDHWQREIATLRNNAARVKPPALDIAGSIFIDPTIGITRPRQVIRWLEVIEELRILKRHSQAVSHSKSIAGNIEAYLDSRKLDVQAGELKASGYDILRWRANQLKQFAGELAIDRLDGATLENYRQHLLSKLKAGDTTNKSAALTLNAAKAFYRWCWRNEVIESLPRNIETCRIKVETQQIATWEVDEVLAALDKATERTKLFLMLMLNCGMYQADISELRQSEVNWTTGTITRKRTKTKARENVPVVTYRLWDETFTLLKKYRSCNSEFVLTTVNDTPLKVRYIKDDGTPYHVDNVAKRFQHLQRQLKKSKQTAACERTMMELRKTSASKLEEHKDYGRYAEFFLGKAPSSNTEKVYARKGDAVFDEAVKWLGEQFGFKTSRKPKPKRAK